MTAAVICLRVAVYLTASLVGATLTVVLWALSDLNVIPEEER